MLELAHVSATVPMAFAAQRFDTILAVVRKVVLLIGRGPGLPEHFSAPSCGSRLGGVSKDRPLELARVLRSCQGPVLQTLISLQLEHSTSSAWARSVLEVLTDKNLLLLALVCEFTTAAWAPQRECLLHAIAISAGLAICFPAPAAQTAKEQVHTQVRRCCKRRWQLDSPDSAGGAKLKGRTARPFCHGDCRWRPADATELVPGQGL